MSSPTPAAGHKTERQTTDDITTSRKCLFAYLRPGRVFYGILVYDNFESTPSLLLYHIILPALIYGYVFDTPQSDVCFYCSISSILDPMTWWNYVRVWANNEWVNERRKEAANYIDKHQLCSKAITWLWKIELIDAAEHGSAQHRVLVHPCKCDVRYTVCVCVLTHCRPIVCVINIGGYCCLMWTKATECSLSWAGFGSAPFCHNVVDMERRRRRHDDIRHRATWNWMDGFVQVWNDEVSTSIWMFDLSIDVQRRLFLLSFSSAMFICTNILHGSGTAHFFRCHFSRFLGKYLGQPTVVDRNI